MTLHLSGLAHQIMMLAAQYRMMPGQALPDELVEALLDSSPGKGEVAFDEINAHNLLEEDSDGLILTEAGFDYILEQYKK
jgi:hypothetical protein